MKFRSFSLSVSLLPVCAFARVENGVYPDAIVIGQSAALNGSAPGPGTRMREGAMAYERVFALFGCGTAISGVDCCLYCGKSAVFQLSQSSEGQQTRTLTELRAT
jgi:hypothetical protein